MRLTFFRLAILIAAFCAILGAAPTPALAPWHFQTDFRAGLPAWLSFPLSQDVGYDPTIYTTALAPQPMLVRDVEAHGEKRLEVGIIRSLRFVAGSNSRIRLVYRLETCRSASLRLELGAEDGTRFGAPLPAGIGWHDIVVSGSQLRLPSAGIAVQALVVEASVQNPATGSHQRLFLRSLSIDALRPASLQVLAPQLAASNGDETRVAQVVATPSGPLFVRLAGSAGAEVHLFDPSGGVAETRELPPAGAQLPLPADARPGLWRLVASRGDAQVSFVFLALGASVPAHPTLLLDAAHWRKLQASSALRAAVHAAARAAAARVRWNPAAGDNIALMSTASVLVGLPGYFTLLENYSHAISLNALDYQLTGDAQALEAARRGLLTIARWRTWTPPWFAAHGLHTYYEVGVFSQRVAFGYDLVANQLTPAERATIADAFWRLAIQPAVQEYFLDNRLPIAASNHMAHAVGGALALAVASAASDRDLASRKGAAIAELLVAYRRLLRGLFPGDGSEAEPAGYQEFAMVGMSWGAAALDALGIHPPGLASMRQSFWWPSYVEYANTGRQLALLDTGDFGGWLGALSGFAWPASHGGDAALRAWYGKSYNPIRALADAPPPVADTGRALEAAPELLDLTGLDAPSGAQPPAPPLARIFPKRGSIALRSGWQSGATVVALRVGPWFNHHHMDEGSFQIAARGEKIVGEAGYADYYKEPLYPSYFTQAAGHNTILIDGDPFSQSGIAGRYWRAWSEAPAITAHLFLPGLDYVAANLQPAYGGRLAAYSRDYVLLGSDLFLVRDRVSASAPHSYTWLLHAPPGDAVVTAGQEAEIDGQQVQATIVNAAGGRWRLAAAPVAEGEFGDFDGTIAPRKMLSLVSAPGLAARFLVGIQLGGRSEGGDLAAFVNNNSEGLRSRRLDVTVLSRTGSGPLVAGGFTTDGDLLAIENQAVLATDLRNVGSPGGWKLSASRPISVLAAAGAQHIEVWAGAACEIALAPARAIRLDGRPAAAAPFDLTAGEHRLDIVH